MKRGGWLAVLLAAAVLTGCSEPGRAAPAGYAPGGPSGPHAVGLPDVPGALAYSPDAGRVATVSGGRVCVRSRAGSGADRCTAAPAGSTTVAFSPDGRLLAVGTGLNAATAGAVTLFDPDTGRTTPVPGIPGVAGRTGDAAEAPFRSGTAYAAMAWNGSTGHLVLVNLLRSDTVSVARVVDLDPDGTLLRPTGDLGLTGQGFSGYLAVGGPTVAGGVFLSQQLPADLVVSDLTSGARSDFGVVADAGQTWPLAVSPDGGLVLVGRRKGGVAGPPVLVSTAGQPRRLLSAATGDVVLAAFSPDGRAVVTLGADAAGGFRLAWTRTDDPSDTTILTTVTGPFDPHGVLTWDRSGVVAVTGAASGTARAWHLSG